MADQDELLKYAEDAAGGSLDLLDEVKPGWFQGVRPDGVLVRIEWEPVGHSTTNEGPHVTVRILEDADAGVQGGWKVVRKAFIQDQEQYGWNYCD